MSASRIASLLCIAALALAFGCGQRLNPLALKNAPPEVCFAAPSSPLGGVSEAIHMASWIGSDADGRVDHYLVSVNPAALDRVDAGWTSTAERSRLVTVRRAAPLAAQRAGAEPREPVILAVRAVDDRGAMSEPAVRAFFDDNVAPSVMITSPRPSAVLELWLPPSFHIRWQGTDPDGQATQQPVKYKFRLFRDDDPEFPIQVALANPDSLRRFYAPAFAGWDSVPGDSLAKTYQNLEPGRRYLFAITAFDEAGDYDPVFSLNKNMLRFRVGVPGTMGPRITMFNEFFYYRYPTGGFSTDPSAEVPVSVPDKVPVTFKWFAEPGIETSISKYRWALDVADVFDETPRAHRGDLRHWSAWSLGTTSATIPPFHGKDAEVEHRFYIEAADDFGQVSLGIIRLRVVRTRFDSELLIVDDTRLRPDQGISGRPDTVRAPLGPWPTAAELDTFLYARGGVGWRSYPPGTTSQPGIFAGYSFDTVGTRTGTLDPSVPLETLGRYRHVVWIVDGKSATYDKSGMDLVQPQTALRYMCNNGRINTLAQYVERGGHLWVLGGGAGYASMISRNDNSNDRPLVTFSSLNSRGELAPGGFMYEIPRWQTEFKVAASQSVRVRRSPFPIFGGRGADYTLLPEAMAVRSAVTDPVPPLRNVADFYFPLLSVEFLGPAGGTAMDCARFPWKRWGRPDLDTLFVAKGGPLPPEGPDPANDRIVNPVMTCFRGDGYRSVVFSGFDLWSFSRRDCARLVDAVLQGMWHLQRAPVMPPAAAEEPVAIEPTVIPGARPIH